MLDRTTKYIILYDIYQELLTDKQKRYTELYFQDDLSFTEIAEEFNISRQGAYEHIKRTEEILDEYEEKLKLFEKYQVRQKIIADIENILTNPNENNYLEIMEQITLLKRID